MKRRFTIAISLLIVIFSTVIFSFSKSQQEKRPNILLIVSEDHGQHLSCYGDKVIKTPNLDNIASHGMRFTNAYVTQSVCSPSRSSILSGLYPHQTGLLGLTTYGFRYAMPVQTIYARMKAAGYRTGMIGKLHVEPESDFPIDFHPIKGPNYERKQMNDYAKYAEEFINKNDEPFFLMVNYPDAHWPFVNEVEGSPKKTVKKEAARIWDYLAYENPTIREYITAMYNCLLRLDECVGMLMQKLNASGKQRNTLVIYLSDHGDELARGKFDIYEAANKVPFIVSWAGKFDKGAASDALVSSIDIVPTMLEVAGIAADKDLPGRSLVPLLKNPKAIVREYLFTEKNVDQVDLYFPRRAVRDKKFKLIYSLLDQRENIVAQRYMKDDKVNSPLGGSPTMRELKNATPLVKKIYNAWLKPNKIQLYDLDKDPWEFNDLSEDPVYDEVKKRLLAELTKWQEQTNDPLRFPDKLAKLTQEIDTIKIAKEMKWKYPEYLYGAR